MIAIIVSVCAISFGDGVSFLESLGIISKTHDDDTVVAEYNGFKVTQAMIDTQRSTDRRGRFGFSIGCQYG